MVNRNRFEMSTHNYIVKRNRRDKQEATFSGGYHNDKPLYWTMFILIAVFGIIALAIWLNK